MTDIYCQTSKSHQSLPLYTLKQQFMDRFYGVLIFNYFCQINRIVNFQEFIIPQRDISSAVIFPTLLHKHTSIYKTASLFLSTVNLVNKGHPRERQNMVVIDKWPLFGGYFVLFNQWRVIGVWSLFTGWSLFGGGL